MDLLGDSDLSFFCGNIYDAFQSAQEMDAVSTFIKVLYSLTFKETCDINGVDTTCIYVWENRKDSLLYRWHQLASKIRTQVIAPSAFCCFMMPLESVIEGPGSSISNTCSYPKERDSLSHPSNLIKHDWVCLMDNLPPICGWQSLLVTTRTPPCGLQRVTYNQPH